MDVNSKIQKLKRVVFYREELDLCQTSHDILQTTRQSILIPYLLEKKYDVLVFCVDAIIGDHKLKVVKLTPFYTIFYIFTLLGMDKLRIFFENRLRLYIEKYLYVPDRKVFFMLTNIFKVIKNVRHDDIVFTSAPFESYHLAMAICKKFKRIKWIADFRDLWLQDPVRRTYPTVLHKKLNQLFLKWVYSSADIISFNNTPYKEWAENEYPEYKHKFEMIPVFNELIKLDEAEQSRIKEKAKVLEVTFAGFMDKGQRIPYKTVLDTFAAANTQGCGFKLKLLGHQSEKLKNYIKIKGYENLVDIKPPMKLKEVYEHCSRSDALLVTLNDLQFTNMIVPKKLYDYLNINYMGYRIPILGLVPDDSACARIINSTGTGFVNQLNYGGVDFLCEIYGRWQNNKLKIDPNEELESYMAENLIPKWLNIVDKLSDT